MTTPVFTRKVQSVGEKMEMTTPVITKRVKLSHGLCSFFIDRLLFSLFNT